MKAVFLFGNIKLLYSLIFTFCASLFTLLSLPIFSIFIADFLARLISFSYSIHRSKLLSYLSLKKLPNFISNLGIGGHKNLLIFGSLGAIASSLSSTVLSLILAGVFGLTVAGHFAIIERLVFSPLGLLAGAISQAVNSFIATKFRTKSYSNLLVINSLLLLVLIVIGCALFLLLDYLVPKAYHYTFNDQNLLSIQIFKTLLPLAIISFIASPFNMALTILGFQKLQLLWDTARFIVLTWLFFVVFSPDLGVINSLEIYANVQSSFYIVFLILLFLIKIRKSFIDRYC